MTYCSLSISYFPPVQYFTKILKFAKVIIEQNENFIKQSYRNRCEIYGTNGKQCLSIPIVKNHNVKTAIKDVKISYDTNWVKLHVKSIESAYRSAPFYEFYADEIISILQSGPVFLFDFNYEILNNLLQLLEIEKEIEFSQEYKTEILNDFRYQIHPKDKTNDNTFDPQFYQQVFTEKHGFIANLSIIDVIFNLGPQAVSYLKSCISG